MPEEIIPSSFRCDCGFQSDHGENTIRELKERSLRMPQCLDAEDNEHEIVFHRGRMTSMWCPNIGKDLPVPTPPKGQTR